MDLQKKIEELTDEQREKARALKTPEEIIEFAKEEGVAISDDELESLSGGSWSFPSCEHTSRS